MDPLQLEPKQEAVAMLRGKIPVGMFIKNGAQPWLFMSTKDAAYGELELRKMADVIVLLEKGEDVIGMQWTP